MLLVDTHVLVDVLQDDPQWAGWSINQLRAQSAVPVGGWPLLTRDAARLRSYFPTVQVIAP